MKQVLILLLLCIGSYNINAQEEEEKRPKKPFRHELGINSNALFDRLARFQQDSSARNPYLMTYRVSRGHWGIGLSGGGTYQKNRAAQKGFADSESDIKWSTDLRLGVHYRNELGRGFWGLFGFDAVAQRSREEQLIDSGFDVVQRLSQSESIGGGPTIGLQWWMTKRLALGTEAGFYWVYGTNETARIFKNFPELDDSINQDETTNLKTLLPASIFLVFKFGK